MTQLEAFSLASQSITQEFTLKGEADFGASDSDKVAAFADPVEINMERLNVWRVSLTRRDCSSSPQEHGSSLASA